MKITLELSRDEAHFLNDLLMQGIKAAENGSSSGAASREHYQALSVWNCAYVEAMPNDEI